MDDLVVYGHARDCPGCLFDHLLTDEDRAILDRAVFPHVPVPLFSTAPAAKPGKSHRKAIVAGSVAALVVGTAMFTQIGLHILSAFAVAAVAFLGSIALLVLILGSISINR
jgi:hypothetical protein